MRREGGCVASSVERVTSRIDTRANAAPATPSAKPTAPPIAAAALKALELVERSPDLRDRLWANTARFREGMTAAGFTLAGAGHPIIPVMLGDAKLASTFADAMLDEGIYVIGFSYPVVPKGQARIRTQMSAAHTSDDILGAIRAFKKVGLKHNVLSGQ